MEMILVMILCAPLAWNCIKKALVGLAVRAEQERPTNENFIYRQERIAAASRQHSEWARIQAQAVGAFQAISAREYDY